MNSKNKSLIKGTGIYAIGTFGTKILSFLIVPLYTYYIATSDMGVYDILMSTINLLTPIVTLQISDAAYRWIIQDKGENREKYIRSTIQVVITNCFIAIIIILVVNHFANIPYCLYFCAVLALSRAFQSIQKILRALKNQWLFAFSGITYTVVFLGLNVVQLCFLGLGVESLFQSAVIANIVALIVMVIFEPGIRVNFFHRPDLKLVGKFYKYSVPLVPNYLNWWVINSSDRYIVLWALGSSANGVLAIAHKFPTMLQSILSLFTYSWQDVSIADTERGNEAYYTEVFQKYSRVALTMLWALIPVTKIVIELIMSEAYKSASEYVAFYYLGAVFQSFASFYGVGYLRSKKTGRMFSTSIFGAIVNAIVNISLIKVIGLQAAAISTFFGFLIMWLIRERQNREELGIKIKWSEFITLTVSAMLMAVLSNMANNTINFVLAIIGIAAFFILNKNDIIDILRIVMKKKSNKQ